MQRATVRCQSGWRFPQLAYSFTHSLAWLSPCSTIVVEGRGQPSSMNFNLSENFLVHGRSAAGQILGCTYNFLPTIFDRSEILVPITKFVFTVQNEPASRGLSLRATKAMPMNPLWAQSHTTNIESRSRARHKYDNAGLIKTTLLRVCYWKTRSFTTSVSILAAHSLYHLQ